MSVWDFKPETISSTRTGGALFATVVILGGFLRIVLPTGAVSRNSPSKPEIKLAQSSEPAVKSSYSTEIAEKISESFGCLESANASAPPDRVNWRVPPYSRSLSKFIIAFVPDPVHTHLSLLFDRDVEAMESAVPQINFGTEEQPQNFVFDRSILPWRTGSSEAASDPKSAAILAAEKADREKFPGLLIFRMNGDADTPSVSQDSESQDSEGQCPPRKTLFIFLVAETPTSGIRTLQFQNSLHIMREIRKGSGPAGNAKSEPLLLLGPNFSGSLGSLEGQLKQLGQDENISDVFAYSGTVTNDDSAKAFRKSFPETDRLDVRFASFQQNDGYAIEMFARFANSRGFRPEEIAVLSEGDTVYGNQAKSITKQQNNKTTSTNLPVGPNNPPSTSCDNDNSSELAACMVYLNFPREISSFRSAYEKQLASQQQAVRIPGKPSLPLDADDEGKDDDAVAPFAEGQTPLSQEAVMLGLVTELQKHHIKFTILLATNPMDQVFLASYLRSNYPQGRIVVTTPDLMLGSQDDALLNSVLGLNNYSLVPALSDSLCRFGSARGPHVDRLFNSSLSVGIYNATLGLMAILADPSGPSPQMDSSEILFAPYVEYSSADLTQITTNESTCDSSPLLWLTILGRDGYWPIAALTNSDVRSTSYNLPIVPTSETSAKSSSLPEVLSDNSTSPGDEVLHTRTAWNVAYSICLAVLILHLILSWTGSFLSNWEAQAQFARSHDRLGVYVIAIGAFWLSTCFVLLMCTRNPLISWRTVWDLPLTLLLWSPLPVFAVLTTYDFVKLRNQQKTGRILAGLILAMTLFQLLLACNLIHWFPYTWSNRLIHLSSGVSPILPFLLLCVAGYWWAWLSLRSVSIVDLRRPRLPAASRLPQTAVRFSDSEGEKVRNTAHPLGFGWRIVGILGILLLVSLTTLEWKHPLQSLEGNKYDWGYSLALGAVIAVFLSCLIRLVLTWVDYKQILSALDHSPLREAFSRMKRLSWRSMWNPGGSTLRETYRVMSRTLENMVHLKKSVEEEKKKPFGTLFRNQSPLLNLDDLDAVIKEIEKTEQRIGIATRIYRALTLQNAAAGGNGPIVPDLLTDKIPDAQKRLEVLLAKYESYAMQKAERAKCPAGTIDDLKCEQGLLSLAVEQHRVLSLRPYYSTASWNHENQGLLEEIQNDLKLFSSSVEKIEKLFEEENGLEKFAANKECFGEAVSALHGLTDAMQKYIGRFPKEGQGSKDRQKNQEEEKPTECKRVHAELVTGLMDSVESLQKQLANTAGTVFKNILDPIWKDEILPAVSEDERIKRPELKMMRAISEEFVALVYVNFLQSVLLQMRSLVICAGGMYVLILCSMNVYPFEPHPALQVLGVALVVVMAVAVGFVYAEMHRDAILSRLTSTNAGELGWDFWFKFVSAGAIPVFSLLAVQFPEIGKFLFSWLAPAMQALK